jgi:chromosome segregation ATPase
MKRITIAGLFHEIEELKFAAEAAETNFRHCLRKKEEVEARLQEAFRDITNMSEQIDRLENPVKYQPPKPPERPWTESEI